MRRSLIEALEREPDLGVCGHADNANEALSAILSLQPDLVVTDIQLKSSSGLDLIRALRKHSLILPIIATTMFDGLRNERLSLAAGASAFVSKDDGPEKLITTVHNVLWQSREAIERL